MAVTAQTVETPAPAPAPPSFQVILPPRPAQPKLDLSRDGSAGIGGVIVVAPRLEPKWSKQLNLDPKGVFIREPELPYLARDPHNECKLKVGNKKTPMGKDETHTGVKCAFSF